MSVGVRIYKKSPNATNIYLPSTTTIRSFFNTLAFYKSFHSVHGWFPSGILFNSTTLHTRSTINHINQTSNPLSQSANMQFTTIVATAILAGSAIAGPLLARQDQPFTEANNNCNKASNCCFSSDGACARQNGGFLGFNTAFLCNRKDAPPIRNSNYCDELGVSVANCTADCCRVDSGTGRNCPVNPSKIG